MFEFGETMVHYPEQTIWAEQEAGQLLELYMESLQLRKEEEEVYMVYDFGKPVIFSDDPIEHMLENEAYRFEFEEHNLLYKTMKENQFQFKEKVESLAKSNLLFFSYLLVEKKETLGDTHELFARYDSWDALVERMNQLSNKLKTAGIQTSKGFRPNELSETLRRVM